jgi:hypothetical protein
MRLVHQDFISHPLELLLTPPIRAIRRDPIPPFPVGEYRIQLDVICVSSSLRWDPRTRRMKSRHPALVPPIVTVQRMNRVPISAPCIFVLMY